MYYINLISLGLSETNSTVRSERIIKANQTNIVDDEWLISCELCLNKGCEMISLAYTPWAIKKGATYIFTMTLANVDRFQ